MLNVWHVEFPVGDQVVTMDVKAPATDERADVLVTMTRALLAAGIHADPFEATATLLGPTT